jgi:S1-C subfamily serine protease
MIAAARQARIAVPLILLCVGLPALGIEAGRMIRGNSDRIAETRIADRMGATVEPAESSVDGNRRSFVVTSVAARGPARVSGLQVGDLLIAANEHRLRSMSDLAQAIRGLQASRLTVDRHGKQFQMILRTHGRTFANPGGDAVPQAADRGR